MKKIVIIAASSMLLTVSLFYFITEKQPELAQKSSPIHQASQVLENRFQDQYKQRLIDSIHSYFDAAIRKNQIVGAAIGIVKCDSVIYTAGFGKRNIEDPDIIDEKTIFRIGSVSKGFAGVLTGIHVEKGLIQWEDKVADYIPDFQLANSTHTKKVTLSHVLSHTTGLPYHSFTNLVEDGIPITKIARQFKEVTPIDQPGNIYSYQNAVFALSGKIIEQVTGQSLKEVIQDKIFKPLEMNSASVSYEAIEKSKNVAKPHRRFKNGWMPIEINKKYYDNAIVAGGVNASISDMSKWMKFLLGNNPEVLTSTTIDAVLSPKIEVPGKRQYYQKWPGYSASYYGLGWRIHTIANTQTGKQESVYHHGGSVNNYRSEIAIYPEEDLGICVLFNSQNDLARTCIPALYDIVKKAAADIEEDKLKESLVLL